jgi:protein-tyrosine phosphatase
MKSVAPGRCSGNVRASARLPDEMVNMMDPCYGVAESVGSLIDVNYGTFRGFVRLALGELEFLTGRLRPFVQVRPERVNRLVCVCLGNINRSAFAHVVVAGLGVRVASIGLSTTTGARAFEKAIGTAPVYGFDLSAHRATDFSDYVFVPGDLLLAMEVRHARELVRRGIPEDSIILLGHWARPHRIHIHDPHQHTDQYFRTCFAIIHSAVANLVEELRNVDSPCIQR